MKNLVINFAINRSRTVNYRVGVMMTGYRSWGSCLVAALSVAGFKHTDHAHTLSNEHFLFFTFFNR